MFNNNSNENKKEETTNQNIENIKNKYYKGKHLNKKLYKIIFGIITVIITYNIFKAPPTPKIIEKKETQSTEETTIKENPFNKTYKEVKDIENKDQSTNTNPTNTYNESLTIEQEQKIEKLKKLEEESEQAKRSAISFQIYDTTTPNSQQQVTTQIPYADYDQNRQGSKKNFLMNEESSNFYSNATIIDSISPYELKAGDFIPAIVETAMNSDIYGKVVLAKVTQNIYDTVTGKYLLIPQGTVLTGVYDSNITWGQERLLVIWQRLRFPNGSSIRLDNMQGVDMLGQAGLKGKINNHFATLLKGVLLSSAMGATAAIVTDDKDDWKSSAGEGAGLSIIQIGDKFTTKALDRQPTIEIKTGERFNVMIHSDLILKPYKMR